MKVQNIQDIKNRGENMQDLEYIKNFSKINISKICRKNRINRSNLCNGKSTRRNERLVREEIESEIAKLYIKEDENGEY